MNDSVDIPDDLSTQIVAAVRSRSEYMNLSEAHIRELLNEYLLRHPGIIADVMSVQEHRRERHKHFKSIIKHIRSQVRDSYGIYQLKPRRRKELLAAHDWQGLMQTHLSTKERLAYYDLLYQRLDTMVDISSIMDLGCGLNPLSVIHMPSSPRWYCAVELSEDDAAALDLALSVLEIPHQVTTIDLARHTDRVSELDHASTGLLFKMADILEHHRRGITAELLETARVDSWVVSFTTVNVRQQRLRKSRRLWFEKICDDLGWNVDDFQLGEELFYVLTKRATFVG